MPLETLLKERIRAQGPISVSDYMALALTHPTYGYYVRKDPLGVQGDFITAPEISQVFGELIGAWMAAQWLRMGKPEAALVELGPGRGTLMADCLRATKHVPEFHDSVSVHLVEISPALKEKQWQALAGKHRDLNWHMSIEELPEKPLFAIANEFFDALPIRQFICDAGKYSERMIGLDDKGNLQFMTLPTDALPPILPASLKTAKTIYEYNEAAMAVTDTLARHIAALGGAALVIDYGYSGGSQGDTLQTVREHQYQDVLIDPGTADLTAHVDFDALADAAQEAGASVFGPVPQGAFLMRLGALSRLQKLCEKVSAAQKSAMISALERLTSPEQMGELFKVLCIAHPAHPTPEGF
jgi:NADH dehydrogenase [ubiquinone] 1 alpha subcomplex assembly factor 7